AARTSRPPRAPPSTRRSPGACRRSLHRSRWRPRAASRLPCHAHPVGCLPLPARALEILDLALVLLGLGAGAERAEVSSLAGFRVLLHRVEAKLPRSEP